MTNLYEEAIKSGMIKAMIEVGSDDPLHKLWQEIIVTSHRPNSLDTGKTPRHLERMLEGISFLDRARVRAMIMSKDIETWGCEQAAAQREDILQKTFAHDGHLPFYFRKGVSLEKEIKTFAVPVFLSTPDIHEHILLLMHTRADRRFVTDPKILERKINEAMGFHLVDNHHLYIYNRREIIRNFEGWVQQQTGFDKGEINPLNMQNTDLRVLQIADPCLSKGTAFTNAGSRSWSIRIGKSEKYFSAIQKDAFLKEQQRMNGNMGMYKPFLWLEISERHHQPGNGWDVPFSR